MLYYRVPDSLDGKVTIVKNKYHEFIRNELYTEKECEKYNIPFNKLEPVYVSKRNIYWSFGCRFEIGKWYTYGFEQDYL